MSKDNKGLRSSPLLKSFFPCFSVSVMGDDDHNRSSGLSSGPVATMIAAEKHFSAAHKLRLG